MTTFLKKISLYHIEKMSTTITQKIVSGKLPGSRGSQGLPSDPSPLGPQGIDTNQGPIGENGTPGPTCACRLDQEIQDVSATGANDSNFLTYNITSQRFELQDTVSLTVFSDIPTYSNATGAREVLGDYQLYKLPTDQRIYRTMPESAFYAVFKTDNSGTSNSDQLTLPFSGTTNATVFWGDGTTDTFTTSGNKTHTYPISGNYLVKIVGPCSLRFSNGGDRQKLLEIREWGSNYTLTSSAFHGCSNLNLPITRDVFQNFEGNLSTAFRECTSLTDFNNIDKFTTSGITSLLETFWGCNFDANLNNWDFSQVTILRDFMLFNNNFNNGGESIVWNTINCDFDRAFEVMGNFNVDVTNLDITSARNCNGMFYGCTKFNNGGPDTVGNTGGNTGMGGWDVSLVTRMSNMFAYCDAFNVDISPWDVSRVITMSNMFDRAFSFNQPIGGTPNGATGWNVSDCSSMSLMFANATRFNQYLGNFDTSQVTSMNGMFLNATSFNNGGYTGLGKWPIKNVTNMGNMFLYVTLDTPIYDDLLIGWAGQTGLNSLSFHGGNSIPSPTGPAAEARNFLVTEYGWTITDGAGTISP